MKKTQRKAGEGHKARALQLKVTLIDYKPPIWRRLKVPEDIGFEDLHMALQLAMGWTDSHLHQFEVKKRVLSPPDPELDALPELEDYSKLTLADLRLRKGQKLWYRYDFGDDWLHEILVEEASPAPTPWFVPVCLQGARACPPEDCGGIYGYKDLLAALADPEDPDHEELLDWIGGPFDPEAFHLASVNARLRTVFQKTKG